MKTPSLPFPGGHPGGVPPPGPPPRRHSPGYPKSIKKLIFSCVYCILRLKTAISSCVYANLHFGFLGAPCAKPLCLLHLSLNIRILFRKLEFLRCLFQRPLPRPPPGVHFGDLRVSPGGSWGLLKAAGGLLWTPLEDPLGVLWGLLGAPWSLLDAFG